MDTLGELIDFLLTAKRDAGGGESDSSGKPYSRPAIPHRQWSTWTRTRHIQQRWKRSRPKAPCRAVFASGQCNYLNNIIDALNGAPGWL